MKNMEQLTQDLLFFDDAYQQGQPVITDTEYEKKYAELQKLESATGVVLPNSPTQKITDIKVNGLETVVHTVPMLSLAKTTDYNELKKWFKSVNSDILVEPKCDGLTLILRYSSGQPGVQSDQTRQSVLVDAITRGNGLEGQRVFALASQLNLPREIDFQGDLEVRGEALIPFAEFDRVNNGQYANPRSLAAGTMMMLDVEEALKRGLEIKIFDLISAEGKTFETRQEQKEFLTQLGFPVVSGELFEEFDRITSYCSKYETNTRKELPFPIDGLVLKCNSIEKSERLGSTGHHPLHSIAWKFGSEEAFTTMRDIIVQIGKNGQVTPVAIFDPITIDGVEITRCTLHNPEFVYKNDIRVGQRCVIARANDVIPKWIKSVPTDGDTDLPVWKMPTECPSCGSPIKTEGPMAFCTGDNCPAQQVEQIIHYCSRDAMDIEGLGESNVKLFFERGFIKTPADLYSLQDKADEIMEIEGFGDKKLDKILESIEATKTQPLSRALYAINVPYLGRTNSRNLAARFSTIDAITSATYEQLISVDGIGDMTAKNILRHFDNAKTKILVERLKDAGVSMADAKPIKTQDALPLSGKTLVITGTLSMKRSEFEDMIRAYGGKPVGSVSKNCDFVILGSDQSGSSKHKKALELGVTIISEDDFYSIVGKN